MGFTIKTALFGISLRKASLILLHIHVVYCVLTSLNKFSDQGSTIDKLMKGDVGEWTIGVFLVKSLAVECYIFMTAIWSIFKQKSINVVLNMALAVILLNSFNLIYVTAVINFGVQHTLGKDSVRSPRTVTSPSKISEMNKLCIFNLLINSYTALVIYSYCVELKQQCVSNVLPTYSSVHNKREADIGTDEPPAYEDLISLAPHREPNETTANV